MVILCVNLIVLSPDSTFISRLFFAKDLFFFRIQICRAHASSYVTMVDYVFKFRSYRVNFVSSQRFLIADYIIYKQCFSFRHVILSWQFLDYFLFMYKAARFLRIQRDCRMAEG